MREAFCLEKKIEPATFTTGRKHNANVMFITVQGSVRK